MTKIYLLEANTANDVYSLAYAYGDLDTMAYLARKLRAELEDAQYTVTLAEVETVKGAATRTVAAVTGDGDTVGYVLSKRLKAERAAE
jgi:hypothetical protein